MNKALTIQYRLICLFVLMLAPVSGIAEETIEQQMKNGVLAYTRADIINAMKWFRKAAEQGHAPAQTRLARLLDTSEQNQEAFKWYQLAAEQYSNMLEKYPSEIYMMLGFGWTYLKMGKTHEARAMFEQLLSIHRQNTKARAGLEALL